MNQREQVLEAIRTLAKEQTLDQVTLADVARVAGVHWTTVRPHVGDFTSSPSSPGPCGKDR